MLQVPYFRQNRDYTCGPACLRMVFAYWGYETDEVSRSMLCGTNVGSNLSVPPDIFKEAWQQAKNEVILTWPSEKTFIPKSKK